MRYTAVPFQDFRDFLDTLRAQGQLIDVDRPVALELEVAKALRKSPAVGGTPHPFVGGVYNSRSKALIAFGCTEDTVFDHILTGLSQRIPPIVVDAAPVHENVLTGDDIDLSMLPVPKYSPDDGGPHITPGIVVSRDPETQIPDMGPYRFETIDKQTLSFMAQPCRPPRTTSSSSCRSRRRSLR